MSDSLHDLMRDALVLGTNSRDRSTQIGGVLLSPDGSVIGTGWNDIPPGVEDFPERRERPLKYEYVLHCECSTILSAARVGHPTEGTTLVCPFSACCNPCATTIIGAGVARMVRLPLPLWLPRMPAFMESVLRGDVMLMEAGVEIVEMDATLLYGVTVLLGGEFVAF